jgi:hypothetical protein
VARRDAIRDKALTDLQRSEVLTLDGPFGFGNGCHGRVCLTPASAVRSPSTIWRVAQDLLDPLPAELPREPEVVAGPVTGGACCPPGGRRSPRRDQAAARVVDGRVTLREPSRPCSARRRPAGPADRRSRAGKKLAQREAGRQPG